jgi:uncharacterized protein YecE (DUF72 family)
VVPHPIRIGCSGWHYASWRGVFYPATMPARDWLTAYAREFDCVEINSSFYRLPSADTFAAWRASVPPDFIFAVKASRYLTHFLRLTRPAEPVARLVDRIRHLETRLGPVVYQLPPRWVPDATRFTAFLDALPRSVAIDRHALTLEHVVEFRDARGYERGVLDLLRRRDVSLCVHDMEPSASPRTAVGPIAYVRFHGYGRQYGGSYPAGVLRPWARWIRTVAASRPVYAFFNNDADGHAVANAQALRQLVKRVAA